MRDKLGRFVKGSGEGLQKGHKINVGRKHSKETKERMSENRKENKNPNWKGDKVEYGSLHNWIRRHKSKPEFCEECKINKPYDLANISGKYKRDINDFEWLCRKCHMKKDGRLKKLNKLNQNKAISEEEKKTRKKEYWIKNKKWIIEKRRKLKNEA